MLRNLLPLALLFVFCAAQPYSKYIEENCLQCVKLGLTFYKSIYPVAPIDYLCKKENGSFPFGFIVSHVVHLPEDCTGIHDRPLPPRFAKFDKETHTETYIAFGVTLVSYIFCLFFRDLIAKLKSKITALLK